MAIETVDTVEDIQHLCEKIAEEEGYQITGTCKEKVTAESEGFVFEIIIEDRDGQRRVGVESKSKRPFAADAACHQSQVFNKLEGELGKRLTHTPTPSYMPKEEDD